MRIEEGCFLALKKNWTIFACTIWQTYVDMILTDLDTVVYQKTSMDKRTNERRPVSLGRLSREIDLKQNCFVLHILFALYFPISYSRF